MTIIGGVLHLRGNENFTGRHEGTKAEKEI
jgi:hypothetical protein